MGLLSLDETVLVNIEAVPSLLKGGLDVAGHLVALELMGGLENNPRRLGCSLLHKDLLAILIAVVVFALDAVLIEYLLHNFVLVGSVEIGG